MKKAILTICLMLLLLGVGFTQRKRKPKPRPKPAPVPTKPVPDSPAPKSLGNCNSALWSAKCSMVGNVCVQGMANEGCLTESDQCTNCFRGSPTPQPKPKLQTSRNDWPGAILGKFVKGAGYVIDNPGAWSRKGIRAGDVITSVDGVLVDSAETLLRMLPEFYKAKRFVVVQVREVAVK